MKTRLRTPSTDQSLKRQPHRKKCTRTANCFFGQHPGKGRTFIRGLGSSRTIRRCLAEGRLGPLYIRVLPYPPTHRCLRSEWCHVRGNYTSAEWNKVFFSDEFRFNLISDDHHVRVWRPRGKRLNSAFSLQ
ncbi:uncharacterized protein TNCV_2522241 [Trichonephila clavipes]|nr:uncharacterized protein TNCV_2522241 [Trichonephila clavipes]